MLTKQHMHLAVKMILVKYIWETKMKGLVTSFRSLRGFSSRAIQRSKKIAVLIDASPWIRTLHLIYFRGKRSKPFLYLT